MNSVRHAHGRGSAQECQCRVVTLAVVGNIGTGKTTFVDRLCAIASEDCSEVTVQKALEEVKEWTTVHTPDGTAHDLLQLYYDDQKANAVRFQNNMLTKRLLQQTTLDDEVRHACVTARGGKACPRKTVLRIAERTARCGAVFADVLVENKKMSALDRSLFSETLSLFEKCIRSPDMIVHLDSPPAECDKRIRFRSRKAESGIPIEYLTSIANGYAKMLSSDDLVSRVKCVHNVDGMHLSQEGATVAEDIISEALLCH